MRGGWRRSTAKARGAPSSNGPIGLCRGRTLAALIALWFGTVASDARAAGLVADLSSHLIAITTAFSGTDVLLFGATDEPGAAVAVVIRGPAEETLVRRKSRVGPVWLNTDGLAFEGVPSFYAVAASGPLEEIATPDELRRQGIGVDHLDLVPLEAEKRTPGEIGAFRAALIRNKQKAELYSSEVAPIRFIGQSLFRSTIAFPANVPPGNYQVQVFELRDKVVVGAQRTVLIVSKVGVEAEIFDVARNRPALYGLASILIAVCAGWTASAVFKK
ncbi:MAG: TIGR02186 family protein [Geminicoccaceae bacterium]|nr:TIGR02186 family protein [Geminicoccaceae bacterium]